MPSNRDEAKGGNDAAEAEPSRSGAPPPTDNARAATGASRVRSVGCQLLAQLNPLPADTRGDFDEPTHTYTVDGEQAGISTTGLVEELFERFDATTILEQYYNRWKHEQDPRYWEIIQEHIDTSGAVDDDAAKLAIAAKWQATGQRASKLGIAFHLHVERILNKVEVAPCEEIAVESTQFRDFRSAFLDSHGLIPFRTELMVWCKNHGVLCAAGQIDALFTSPSGFFLFDWKRVAPKKDLSETARPFKGRMGRGLAESLPDTPYYRYSLQTSIYAEMLKSSHGIDVEDRMYVLRVHADIPAYDLVHCANLRGVAASVLSAEYDRLAAASRGDETPSLKRSRQT